MIHAGYDLIEFIAVLIQLTLDERDDLLQLLVQKVRMQIQDCNNLLAFAIDEVCFIADPLGDRIERVGRCVQVADSASQSFDGLHVAPSYTVEPIPFRIGTAPRVKQRSPRLADDRTNTTTNDSPCRRQSPHHAVRDSTRITEMSSGAGTLHRGVGDGLRA